MPLRVLIIVEEAVAVEVPVEGVDEAVEGVEVLQKPVEGIEVPVEGVDEAIGLLRR